MPGPSSTLFAAWLPDSAPSRGVRDLVAALYRQAGLVALCTAVGAGAALALYAGQPRVFTSSAKVRVQTDQRGSPFFTSVVAPRERPNPQTADRRIEAEIALMLTRANAQSVVEKLHIRDDQLARGGASRPPPDAARGDRRSHTVDLFLDGLSVEPSRSTTAAASSSVLVVRFACVDRALAPLALGAFLENYRKLGAQQDRRLAEATARVIQSQLAQARQALRESEDGIVALLLEDGGSGARPAEAGAMAAGGSTAVLASAGGMKLDLRPDGTGAGVAAPVAAATLARQALALPLPLRLDEARQRDTEDAENGRDLDAPVAGSQRGLATARPEDTPPAVRLGRLERRRALARQRCVDLQRELDRVELSLRLEPTEGGSRVIVGAPDHPARADGRKALVALLGPIGGLLLGLLLAGLRELGRDRMRSAREVERALGLPVLGAIPTLGGKLRQAHLVANARTASVEPSVVPSELS